MKISNLRDLFQHEVQDLFSAESQIIEALPVMIKAAGDEKLRSALQEHLEVTKEQKQRLIEIGKQYSLETTGHTCKGIMGIIEEAQKGLEEISDPATKDAAIIVSAQRVEHYEIAAYGSAVEFSRVLDMGDAEDLLQTTLDEEKEADTSLTDLAEGGLFQSGINETAAEE